MSAAAQSLEFSSPQNLEPARPELRLYQGGGEGPGLDDSPRPELTIVPDPGEVMEPEVLDVSVEAGEQPVEPAEPAEEDYETNASVTNISERRRAAAKNGARVATKATTVIKTAVSKTKESSSDDYRRRSGGGGGALREYLRKLAAKEHESGCDCYVCAA